LILRYEKCEIRFVSASLILAALLGFASLPLAAQGKGKSGGTPSGGGGGGATNPVAILDSARTKSYFGSAYGYCVENSADPNALGAMEYKRYWGGWEEVLKEMTAAGTISGYDVVSDDFILNDLARSKYKALILSNNANMSQSMVSAIRSWVAVGGHLLATFGSGYDAAAGSTDEALKSKPNKNSLEQLWNDPLTEYVTTGIFGTVSVPGPPPGYPAGSVETVLTQIAGPTANYCNFYQQTENQSCPWYFDLNRLVTGYGDLAIMLFGRSENWPGAYAHFQFANNLSIFDPNNVWPDTDYNKPLPAVVASGYRKGQAVYYAFAPEFIVGLEFDAAGHCSNDGNFPGGDPAPWQQDLDKSWEHNHWAGRTPELRALMKSSIYYLLTTP
jgi:hypothetical protein